MKEVFAIIRQNKINQTKDALKAAGFPSMTARKVMGRGKKQFDTTYFSVINPEDMASHDNAQMLAEAYRLLPKRFINIIVHDNEVEKCVKAIIETNSTGTPGDGKIFVMRVDEVYRIRTGESGISAV
jgi:nitrogen regulatory protein PII 2